MNSQHQSLFVFIQAVAAALCLAMVMNALARRGGLSGMRGLLALVAASSTLGVFSLLGASLESDAAFVARWHVGVRVGLAFIGAGGVGAALMLVRPGDRRLLRWTLAGGVVAAVVGTHVTLRGSPEQFVRTPVSWFPTSDAVRFFDTTVIVLAATTVASAAIYRLVRGERAGRGTMWLLVGFELTVAVSYFVVRMWAPPAFVQSFGVGLISISALTFSGMLYGWRIAGVGPNAYTLLFKSTPRPVVLLDLHTESLVLNAAAEKLLGPDRSAEEILVQLGGAGPLASFLFENAGQALLDRRIDGAEGRVFDVHVHFDPSEELGLLQIDDVTERVEHARRLELNLAERKALQAQVQMNERMAAMGVLVAGVNHEINNPLAYAITNIGVASESMRALVDGVSIARETLSSAGLDALRAWTERDEVRYAEAEGLSALADAADGCGRIREIVASMRLLSRQDEPEVLVDLAQIARAAAKVGRVSLQPGAQLLLELSDQRLPIRGMPGELTRVVTNLVVNAGQSVGEKGSVWVRAFEEDGVGVLEVRDDGPGVAAEHRSRVFEPFFTTKPPGQGTGLGLAISFETVRRHGGELLLVDAEGRGACFQVRLPRCLDSRDLTDALAEG